MAVNRKKSNLLRGVKAVATKKNIATPTKTQKKSNKSKKHNNIKQVKHTISSNEFTAKLNNVINEFDYDSINNSIIKYIDSTNGLIDKLIFLLNNYYSQSKDTACDVNKLFYQLHKIKPLISFDSDGPNNFNLFIDYMIEKLDLNTEKSYKILTSLKNEINHISLEINKIASTNDKLELMHKIETCNKPSFEFIVEFTAKIYTDKIKHINWLENNIDVVKTLIMEFNEIINNYNNFLNATKREFIDKCTRDSIDQVIYDSWLIEWNNEVYYTYNNLVSLLIHVFDNELPKDYILKIINKTKKYINNLNNFFINDRVFIHQKYAFEDCGEILEKFDIESKHNNILDAFNDDIQDIIFSTNKMDEKLYILNWAKKWMDERLSILLSNIKSTNNSKILEKLSKDTFEAIKKINNKNLELFLNDLKEYKAEFTKTKNERNRLLYKMRTELNLIKADDNPTNITTKIKNKN